MAQYRPSLPFATPLILLIPQKVPIKGVLKKVYPKLEEMSKEEMDKMLFYCSFKTFGGTESTVNDVYSVIDTANIETWFRPDIKSDCQIALLNTDKVYEIIGDPENIDMRSQYLKFKVKCIKGGA